MARKLLLCLMILISGCQKVAWNNPYPRDEEKENIRYTYFSALPKTLDPARSYNVEESIFVAQIYEPPLQYHFLKRPYTLVPLTAKANPQISYLDKEGNKLSQDAPNEQVAYTVYDIEIKPGIYYQPHPAFAKNNRGEYYYHHLTLKDIEKVDQLKDFKYQGTRELTADDYVYEIKRLADLRVNSPIYGLMAKHIVGLSNYAKVLAKASQQTPGFLDLRKYPLAGASVLGRYQYRVILKGKYPQFVYWLAMSFFAPIPWEADLFYSQPGMNSNNISFDWYPVGTGPYQLIENNPNRRMVLLKNPNFHLELFPSEGEPGDKEAGYLKNAGQRLPFINKIIFSLDKEYMPRWNKFLQGYYDAVFIGGESFDQAIQADKYGQLILTPQLKNKGIRLQSSVTPGLSYLGFNMLDPIVGGYSEKAIKLRQAISIAMDYQEYINIFLNGRGIVAQGPIPPGIFGYRSGKAGMDPYLYDWVDNESKKKSITYAKQLLAEAGYPNGIEKRSNKPLVLNYDSYLSGAPEEKALLDWLRKQFAKIGIQLNIRGTEYNRFQDKMRVGQAQIFSWAWVADYPDPENFLFLLYGPNGKVRFGGENAANYQNATYDQLFEKMRTLPNNEERQKLIDQMLLIVQREAPWVFGVNPKEFILYQQWNYPSKQNAIANNTTKYQRLDPILRAKLRKEWNMPVLWPLGLLFLFLLLVSLPVFIRYWKKDRTETVKKPDN